MKTWEMIKELTENPQKEFKGVARFDWDNFEYSKIVFKTKIVDGNLITEATYYVGRDEILNGNKIINGILTDTLEVLSADWTEIKKKPVDFITAIESGCKLKVEHPFIREEYEKEQFSNHYKYFTELFEIFGKSWDEHDVRKVLLEGNWYIDN